jgi:pimeloyl-ACP methyl ester carboxylesterase
LALLRTASLQPDRENGILPIDPPTPFFHFTPQGASLGRILVVHGLDVSKEIMQLLSAALADGGFEVYAIDLPGHGDSPVGFAATRARTAVEHALDYLQPIDVVVGHSLGGGLLLDVANERATPRMILLSPAPTPLGAIDLKHTLVVSGRFDIPAIDEFIPELEGAEWWRSTWGAHASALFKPADASSMVRWLEGRPHDVRSASRLLWIVVSILAAVALGMSLMPPRALTLEAEAGGAGIAASAARMVLAGVVAALTLRFIHITGWLHLFASWYLIGFFFVAGSVLWVVAWRDKQHPTGTDHGANLLKAALAAAYVVGVVGLMGIGNFTHVALTGGRWWRFPAIALVSFPFFWFDQISLHSANIWRSALNAVLSRALLGASIVTGVLTLNRDAGFIVLIVHFIVIFWVMLWALSEIVRRHTADPLAAACFAALVQGWLFAAWLVVI